MDPQKVDTTCHVIAEADQRCEEVDKEEVKGDEEDAISAGYEGDLFMKGEGEREVYLERGGTMEEPSKPTGEERGLTLLARPEVPV